MARTIHLLRDSEALLERMTAGGRYGTESDVIMYALAALEDREAVEDARAARLEGLLAEGLADIEAGRTVPIEEVFRELDEIIAKAEARKEAAE